jgi:hypothetical protein
MVSPLGVVFLILAAIVAVWLALEVRRGRK